MSDQELFRIGEGAKMYHKRSGERRMSRPVTMWASFRAMIRRTRWKRPVSWLLRAGRAGRHGLQGRRKAEINANQQNPFLCSSIAREGVSRFYRKIQERERSSSFMTSTHCGSNSEPARAVRPAKISSLDSPRRWWRSTKSATARIRDRSGICSPFNPAR